MESQDPYLVYNKYTNHKNKIQLNKRWIKLCNYDSKNVTLLSTTKWAWPWSNSEEEVMLWWWRPSYARRKQKEKEKKKKESEKRREKEAMDLDFFLPHANDTMRNLFFHVNDNRRLGLQKDLNG